ncbi:RecD/TraA family helicase [Enterococcus phoeniculicola]|jgi:exodeoxyribonuclease V alpha subunit|uniref:ATP-dependent RecD2 DNA helicase n=1 Tax=Enterococcus phoeniculicola ATCC BAA-412 TaxID=1158610 RepID=R3TR16_9ENTE|nr:ATP-dependent RecD-like DNA helicase [Enterococcus phoeniculicola]EOL43969.1 RecD/TraA family helicase [Enterococcus phoeniculicola ATCC BAA-412]EOT75071.1 RecD/TraA family helicase [Enterococcus phoeniculicola ATCC BAA-412]OJG71518.1 RecD/TraA family helicase [Enterococcus phoeniculicola]
MQNQALDANYVVGNVAAIFFQNPSNFYKVLLIRVTDTNTDYKEKELVVTGSFGEIQEEESYRFYGEFVDHPRYGRQLQVDRYQQERPTSANGLVQYLSSDKFPGIGKKTAEKIVEILGENAIERIIEEPDVLKQLPALNEKKRHIIVETIRLNHGMDQVIVGLSQYGFGSQLSFAIYQAYQNEALDIIHENPYQLVEDIEGVGFKRADNLAEQLGIGAQSPKRIRAAIVHQIFQQSVQTGNTYIEAKQLLEQTIRLLETSRPVEIVPDEVANVILQLVEEGKIQQEETKLYENSLYFSEWGIGSSIHRLLARKKEITYDKKEVKKTIRMIEKQLNIQYGESQQKAIEEAIRSPLFILTGGPGTGKTTVINGIVNLFAELNGLDLDPTKYSQEVFPILLAAPTGRAAKRMNETTGLPSGTIHRLLGLNGREKSPTVSTKELEGGLLIVDEMSMVDTWLANTLFKAIPTNMQVIFVGDKDQLPSVGPGQVLHDLLQIEEVPKMELTEIYRQGDGSSIIPLAHEIKEGHLPSDFTKNQKDRSFFRSDAYQIEPLISQIVEKAKKKGFTAQDIQVLAPMYRGPAGIDALNKMMQEIFNPNTGKKKEVTWNETVYRIGDKVLQLVNSPELNVFNGDMGQITGIIYAKDSEDKVDELVIQFDANEVSYKRNEWNKITLSYCCSIHKSQGSEFKMVILPMVHQFQRMLQRNLLYTAITRSKEILILLGEEQAYQTCVAHESASRLTTLKERILSAGEMTFTIKSKLEAFEDSLVGDNPFSDQTVEKVKILSPVSEKRDIKTSDTSVAYESDTTNLETNLRVDEEVTLFDEIEETSGPRVLTLQLIQKQEISPMIGMDGITPQQFMEAN